MQLFLHATISFDIEITSTLTHSQAVSLDGLWPLIWYNTIIDINWRVQCVHR